MTSCELVELTADDVVSIRVAAFSALGVSSGGRNDTDNAPTTIHVGVRVNGDAVATGTLTPGHSPRNEQWPAWRVRGMATLPEAQGHGYGGMILDHFVEYIAGEDGGLLWGNLRVAAVKFYEAHKFVVQNDVFASTSGALHRYGERFVHGSA
jgi:GNAT superfamily N-acetyltransferase